PRAHGGGRGYGAARPQAPAALMAPSLERRVAIDAARAAGQILRTEFRAAHRVAFKGQTTNLVTEMDERAEELIVGRLASAFPDDTILAEERGAAPGNAEPLAGAPTTSLEASLLATGFPYNIRETDDTNLDEYAAFALRCRGVRRFGSAVLDLAWVAAGRLDGFWELRLGAWDVAAAGLFVEEAGGRITNLVGDAVDLDAPAVVASNGRIHDEMLAVLREIRGARGGGAAPKRYSPTRA